MTSYNVEITYHGIEITVVLVTKDKKNVYLTIETGQHGYDQIYDRLISR